MTVADIAWLPVKRRASMVPPDEGSSLDSVMDFRAEVEPRGSSLDRR